LSVLLELVGVKVHLVNHNTISCDWLINYSWRQVPSRGAAFWASTGHHKK